ncbi:hypothetical protein GmRootA79_52550 (plasmid) [Acidovorax sp. A79]
MPQRDRGRGAAAGNAVGKRWTGDVWGPGVGRAWHFNGSLGGEPQAVRYTARLPKETGLLKAMP